ncbi:MAG TPA: alanine racemase [Thermomicrobiales bacterium]|jgi:D-serine deaminase-like pyridoxal phosphate-dependent protein|nr:alanine racemase [Thermomicrobiales bacterium]HRA32234.1 alanine racemase [Thermomicrobiales bacterium]
MTLGYREDLDTPALVVHEEILQHNLHRMADYAAAKEIALRPHFKTHKTAAVAVMQKSLGAGGITCAKLGEAEALADAGVYDDFFVANQIVGPLKLKRLVALMDRAKVRVAVDTADVAAGLNAAMADAGKTLDVIIELNTGQDRAGIRPGDEALTLAEVIRAGMPHLRVIGLMTHEGQVNNTAGIEGMTETALAAGHAIIDTAELLREHGFDISVVSVGSTPAAFTTTTLEGVSEMRPGTYVFNDRNYLRFGLSPDDCALRILATVTSRPAPDRAIVDAGSKTLTSDMAMGIPGHGLIVEYPEAVIVRISEEHGVVQLPESAQGLKVGDKVEIIPNHVCPTVNLQDEIYLVRDGEVVETWPVIARGKVR